MIESNRDLFLQEILDHRRAFCQRFDPVAADLGALREVDYVLARFLVKRLNITAIHADDSGQAAFLVEQAAKPQAAAPTVTGNGQETAPATGFIDLYLFNPVHELTEPLLAAAAAPGSLIMLYGVAGEASAAALQAIARLCGAEGGGFAFIPRGSTPALWRSTAILLSGPAHRAALLDALGDFTAAFAGDDLDALKLAEENLGLKASVQRLSLPGTNQGELDRLKAVATKLESELAAVRRAALEQEKALTTALAGKSAPLRQPALAAPRR